MNPLAQQLLSRMAELTVLRSAETAINNATQNLSLVRLTISDLAAQVRANGNRSAIVIGAGPSLHRQHPAPQILASGYTGDIIAADGALGYCLRHGLVPDYVVTLDPHRSRVCRWFGDPALESRQDGDDYFRRQDLDPHLGIDEVRRNRELIELVNRHGPSIKAVICTSAAPNVARRCLESGMELYWWNPLMDDVEYPNSLTRRLYETNRVPCMVSGGNVGAAAWVATSQVLHKEDIMLVGMDFSYAPGTPVENTQYYKELQEFFGDKARDAFIAVENPHLKETWFADPTYYWYRDCFLQLVAQATSVTYNCTEGGILFGEPVRWASLKDVLAMWCGVGTGG